MIDGFLFGFGLAAGIWAFIWVFDNWWYLQGRFEEARKAWRDYD